jgi:hypothetical protein
MDVYRLGTLSGRIFGCFPRSCTRTTDIKRPANVLRYVIALFAAVAFYRVLCYNKYGYISLAGLPTHLQNGACVKHLQTVRMYFFGVALHRAFRG